MTESVSCGKLQKISYGKSLEAHRLLKRISYAELRPACDIHIGDIRTVKYNSARCRLFDTRDQLCERGFSAAVRSCYHSKPAVELTADTFYNRLSALELPLYVLKFQQNYCPFHLLSYYRTILALLCQELFVTIEFFPAL